MIKSIPSEPRVHHRCTPLDPLPVEADAPPVRGTVLVVEPGESFYLIPLRLMLPDCRLILCCDEKEARQIFFYTPVDVVLIDHSPALSALDLLHLFKVGRPSVPVLVMAREGSEELAVEVFRSGARDYFRKPISVDEMYGVIRSLLELRAGAFKVRAANSSKEGFDKALRYIQTHFHLPLSLAQVAGKSGMSLSSFVRIFKKRTGMTFVDYLQIVRMAAACRMLRDPGLSLLRISLACGYNNQSHFNRVFKKCVGVSPRVYKKYLGQNVFR